jgi:hypothetical protein
MAKRENEKNEYKDNYNKDLKAQPDEECNAYYTRKQRTTDSVLAPDTDAELVDKDDSFAESRNYPNPDAGPLNYKKWDRYGK